MRNFPGTEPFLKISGLITALLLALTLCGCDVTLDDIFTRRDEKEVSQKDAAPSDTAISVIDINGDVHETKVNVIEDTEAEDNGAEEDGTGNLSERSLVQVAANMHLSDDSNYAYNNLTETGRLCYEEIYAILTDCLSKVRLTTKDPDEVDLAFRAVMVDHPEIFYVKGYSIGKYMSGDKLKKIVFSGTYTNSPEEIAIKTRAVDDYVQKVIDGCPEDGSDFEKIKYVYDYLIRNNVYDTESENNQNILSVVENGRTVCQGYTKMMQLILTRMNIFCTLVNGRACGRNGVPDREELEDAENAQWGGHVWNIVKCNGMYYNIDVTWGDATITLMNSDGTRSGDIDVNYEFFLVDDEELVGTHDPEPVVRMPRCNTMEDNYYRHMGQYFTGIDDEQLKRAFERSLSEGESHVFIKAASPEVFDELEDHLFSNEYVFKYLGRTNVRYVEFAERNLIMISL